MRKWTELEDLFIKRNYEQVDTAEIAAMLGLTPRNIRVRAYSLGVKKKRFVKTHYCNESYFKTWSPSMAYILGFITADGCVIYSATSPRLAIAVSEKDKEILDFIIRELESDYPVSKAKSGYSEYFNIVRTAIMSHEIASDLEALGVSPNKTGIEQFPQSLPKEYYFDYFCGLVDGDGSVLIHTSKEHNYKHGRIVLVSACHQFLLDINSYIFDNKGSVFQRKRQGKLPESVLTVARQNVLINAINRMYTDRFSLTRKRKTAMDILELLGQKIV